MGAGAAVTTPRRATKGMIQRIAEMIRCPESAESLKVGKCEAEQMMLSHSQSWASWSMMKQTSPQELAAELESARPPVVLDVRLADDFEACHIPQAVNNAVFEVAFMERLREQLPDKSQP